jgi:hypothetical protein
MTVEFIKCECGEPWRYDINILTDKPIWMPPKRKRSQECHHSTEQALALVDGEWIKVEP